MTIKEIANLAGVSVATVSRTINHQGKASPEVQKRIWDIMKKYNYVPNATGRSLRTTRTGMVMVMVPTLPHSFYSYVIDGIIKAAGQQGYNIITAANQFDREIEERYLNMVRTHQVDGMITLGTTLSPDEIQEFSRQYPFVIACECPADVSVSCVEIDNQKAACDAVSSLARGGHQRIALINFFLGINSSDLREKGYRQALADAGLPLYEDIVLHTGFGVEDGEKACEALLSVPERPTAVLCYSDALAVGMIRGLQRNGLQAGKDMEIIGFDDTDLARVYLPSITSVAQPTADIGSTAFDLLHEKMNDVNSTPKKVTLPHHIVYRETSREPKA